MEVPCVKKTLERRYDVLKLTREEGNDRVELTSR